MEFCIDETPVQDKQVEKFALWVVWIDTNRGDPFDGTDWNMNSGPQELKPALAEAAQERADGFPAKILPEGDTPFINIHGSKPGDCHASI